MNPDANPFRRLLRTTAVMGSATVVNLAISVVRMKVLAVVLGPGGLGLMALYNSVLSSAVALFGAGLGFSGVKHVAQMPPESADLYRARLVLWYGSLGLGVLAAVVLWIFNAQIAEWAIGDRTHATAVGCVGIGVIFSLLASSQTAVLQGQRRIAELAKVQLLSGALSAACAIVIVLWLKSDGIVAAVLAGPIIGAMVGFQYLGRMPSAIGLGNMRERACEFRLLVSLGLLFMTNSLIAQLSEAWVRAWVARELGLESVGHFQAAWVISQSYLGAVLGVMATEFFPRLSETARSRVGVAKIVDDQIAAALALLTPLVLLSMAFAPLIVRLLFSDAFAEALPMLRWQLLGDVLRAATVPLVYVLAVFEKKALYLLIPTLWQVIYVAGVMGFSRRWGLESAGIAYFVAHAAYLAAAYWAVRTWTDVRITRATAFTGAAALGFVALIRQTAEWDIAWGMMLGSGLAGLWVICFALRILK